MTLLNFFSKYYFSLTHLTIFTFFKLYNSLLLLHSPTFYLHAPLTCFALKVGSSISPQNLEDCPVNPLCSTDRYSNSRKLCLGHLECYPPQLNLIYMSDTSLPASHNNHNWKSRLLFPEPPIKVSLAYLNSLSLFKSFLFTTFYGHLSNSGCSPYIVYLLYIQKIIFFTGFDVLCIVNTSPAKKIWRTDNTFVTLTSNCLFQSDIYFWGFKKSVDCFALLYCFRNSCRFCMVCWVHLPRQILALATIYVDLWSTLGCFSKNRGYSTCTKENDLVKRVPIRNKFINMY